MKKTLLFITFTLTTTISNAQLKIKAGTNISSITGHTNVSFSQSENYRFDFKDSTKSKVGFYAGIGYSLNITEHIGFSPEIIYNQMGAKADNYIGDSKSSFYKNYISLPLLFEYRFLKKFKFGIGPQIDYLLKSTYKNYYRNIPDHLQNSLNKEGDDTEMFDKINYGLTAGISYDILGCLSIEAKYYIGLNNSYNEDKLPKFTNATTTAEMKNRLLQIGAAYKF